LAFDHASLGYLSGNMCRPVEGKADYRAALPLFQKLADDNPAASLE
jgi:hypothetical protein